MAYKWNLQRSSKMVLGLEDFNGHVGKYIDGFKSVHGGSGFGIRNIEEYSLNFVMKKNCLLQIHGFTKKKEVTFRSGDNKTKIDFVLVAPKHRRYLRDVKMIPEELQHGLMVIDM